MGRRFTRRFDPNQPRNPEAELQDYEPEPWWGFHPYESDPHYDPRKQAVVVPGGTKHDVYHRDRLCGVLDTDLRLAQRCGQPARIDVVALADARRKGVACPICLPKEAQAHNGSRVTPCVICTESNAYNGTLLHWRRDQNKTWYGLVIYEDDGELVREMVPQKELRPR